MTSVTDGSIAYVCVIVSSSSFLSSAFDIKYLSQYRFCISDVPDWRIKDRVYNWQQLFDQVMEMLKSAKKDDDDWYTDLMDYWNM